MLPAEEVAALDALSRIIDKAQANVAHEVLRNLSFEINCRINMSDHVVFGYFKFGLLFLQFIRSIRKLDIIRNLHSDLQVDEESSILSSHTPVIMIHPQPRILNFHGSKYPSEIELEIRSTLIEPMDLGEVKKLIK